MRVVDVVWRSLFLKLSMPKIISKQPVEIKVAKKTKNFGLVKYVLFIALISFLSFTAGFMASGKNLEVKKIPLLNSSQVTGKQNASLDFGRFWEVWDVVNDLYYDKTKIDSAKMLDGAISGMVRSLGDPYTSYLPKEDNQAINDDLNGSFEGVGMELGYNEAQQLIVVSPIENSPAIKAGIKSKDRILGIDGEDTIGVTLPEAVKKIRGKSGTTVKLKILSDGEIAPKEVDLVRATINLPSIVVSYKDGYGVIKINKFGEKTNSEWDKAVNEMLVKKVNGVIIDVRNNPGGYLTSAVYLGSEFTDGTIVIQEGVNNDRKEFKSERKGKFTKIPVVVLINEGSASASEILAGAIKFGASGRLVGMKSFGKGTIQEVKDFDNGTGLHVTVAKWLMPNGEWIHSKGIVPDYEVEMTTEDIKAERDPQLDKALEVLKTLK